MPKSNDFLKIMSLNVAHGDLLEDLLPYLDRHKDAVDVFCLQEVDTELKPKLDHIFAGTHTVVAATKSKESHSRFYSLATYVSSGLTIIESYEHLKDDPDTGFALTCMIEAPAQNQFQITNVHGVSQPGTKLDNPSRLKQSKSIIDSQDKNISGIVMGDFNLLPYTESVEMFTAAGYRDLIKLYEIPTTRNEVVWNRWPDNKQLYADYAFIRSNDKIDYDFVVDTAIVSDHLPLLLSVKAVSIVNIEPAQDEISVLV